MLEVPLVAVDAALQPPRRAREGDAGVDLVARLGVELAPRGGRALVPTGVALALPEGHAGLVFPRSGLALRHGVTCLNAPGLIDPGFRGEVGVLLVNTDPNDAYEVVRGDRIAQLVVVQFCQLSFALAEALPPSERGAGGFGHSGR